jgi:predicted nucleic acid-binding Zn ribbon protein
MQTKTATLWFLAFILISIEAVMVWLVWDLLK